MQNIQINLVLPSTGKLPKQLKDQVQASVDSLGAVVRVTDRKQVGHEGENEFTLVLDAARSNAASREDKVLHVSCDWFFAKAATWRQRQPSMDDFALEDDAVDLSQKLQQAMDMEPAEAMILKDCVVHVFDVELNPEAQQLCNAMGAMMTDEIVPLFTTHVVAVNLTPVLQSHLNSLQQKFMEHNDLSVKSQVGHSSKALKPQQQQGFLNIKVVTIEWLRHCFSKQEKLDSDLYKAIHSLVSSDAQKELAKKQRQKRFFVKLNIFNGKTFRINTDSFQREDMSEAMSIFE